MVCWRTPLIKLYKLKHGSLYISSFSFPFLFLKSPYSIICFPVSVDALIYYTFLRTCSFTNQCKISYIFVIGCETSPLAIGLNMTFVAWLSKVIRIVESRIVWWTDILMVPLMRPSMNQTLNVFINVCKRVVTIKLFWEGENILDYTLLFLNPGI